MRRGRTVSLKCEVRDPAPNAGWASLSVKIKTRSGKTVATLTHAEVKLNRVLSIAYQCELPRGACRFYVYAKDAAGNRQSRAGSNLLTVT